MLGRNDNKEYHDVVYNTISYIEVWLTDDNGNELDLRKELVTINLRFQEL